MRRRSLRDRSDACRPPQSAAAVDGARWSSAGHAEPHRELGSLHRPVFDLAGRHLATPDLLDPDAGVVGEFEGSVHLTGARRAADVRREARMRDAGLEPVTMTSADLGGLDQLVQRIDAAYARAARRDPTARGWTTTRPAWWIDTDTVAARRALSPAQRQRLLRYRRAIT